LHRINWRDRSATSGIVIGEKSAWGQGYGSEVMQVRTAWAFEELGLHRIESECFVENVGSARCLAKAGYRQVGLARQKRWRQGAWHDCILWEILDEDYFAGR
jgi:RimJ/RimL family protein N-acetyltransferase